MRNYTQIILRGVGQVMFQNNALSGLLFLAGICYNSWVLALATILGTIISTATAQLLNYSKDEIKDGIYGFNGALVGIALWFFFGVTVISTLAIIIGAALSSILMKELKRVIPPFTAPFILITWLLIAILIFVFHMPVVAPPLAQSDSINLFSLITMGLSQVWFQANIITGLLFLLALLVSSRFAAAYALYGTVLGALIALLLSQSYTPINTGIFGYNAVLCAIALGDKHLRSFLLVSLAIILSVFFNIGLASLGIITLTSAFVLATWLIVYLKFLLYPTLETPLD